MCTTGIPKDIADKLADDWGNPPPAVLEGGLARIISHYEAIERSGSTQLHRLKVVFIGASGAGKTSLMRGLREGGPRLTDEADRTVGVDIGRPWKPDATQPLELVLWDFGGQPDYHPTHRLFYTKWALYLLVIDLHKFSREIHSRDEMVDSWLDALLCGVPGSIILVVPTHTDLIGGDAKIAEALSGVMSYVDGYLKARQEYDKLADATRKRLRRAARKTKRAAAPGETKSNELPNLILCGMVPTCCSSSLDLEVLRKKLVGLAVDHEDDSPDSRRLFQHVGQTLPKVRVRASVVMDALAHGTDLLESASLDDKEIHSRRGRKQLKFAGRNFIGLQDMQDRWTDVVHTLGLQAEIGDGQDDTVQVGPLPSYWKGNLGRCCLSIVRQSVQLVCTCMNSVPSSSPLRCDSLGRFLRRTPAREMYYR